MDGSDEDWCAGYVQQHAFGRGGTSRQAPAYVGDQGELRVPPTPTHAAGNRMDAEIVTLLSPAHTAHFGSQPLYFAP
eukprot:6296883-Amphidinium_carterae.1